MIQKINKTKITWFFQRVIKIYRWLPSLMKKKEKTEISILRNDKGNIKTDTTELSKVIRDYYK